MILPLNCKIQILNYSECYVLYIRNSLAFATVNPTSGVTYFPWKSWGIYLKHVSVRNIVYLTRLGLVISIPGFYSTLLEKVVWIISLHLWSEEIPLVEEWFVLILTPVEWKFTTQRVNISSGSLDIPSNRSDHWRHYPRCENKVSRVIF